MQKNTSICRSMKSKLHVKNTECTQCIMKENLLLLKAETFIRTLRSKEVQNNNKDPERRISKYQNIFAKDYTQSWSEEFFMKNTVPQTYVIEDFKGAQIRGEKLIR